MLFLQNHFRNRNTDAGHPTLDRLLISVLAKGAATLTIGILSVISAATSLLASVTGRIRSGKTGN